MNSSLLDLEMDLPRSKKDSELWCGYEAIKDLLLVAEIEQRSEY